MTTGTSAWQGLGMGLHGEYQLTQIVAATDMFTITGAATSGLGDFLVCEDSDGTELAMIRGDGSFRNTVASDAGVRGIDCRFIGSITGQGFNVAANFVTTLPAVSMSASQNYAIRGHLDCSCLITLGGGRAAALMLYMNADTSSAGASRSFIHFDDATTGLANLFTFGNCAVDHSFFTANAASDATHGLRFIHGTTTYYLMATTCVD